MNMNKDYNLEITVKVTETKGIIIGRTILLNKNPRFVAGIWSGNSIVLSCLNPRTLQDTEVLIYTTKELAELYEEGKLEGLVDIE